MAQIIPIDCHPKYRPQFMDPPIIPGGEEVDQAMTEMLQNSLNECAVEKEIAAAMEREEKNALGNNVCWQCTHRSDPRPRWKKILASANESTYECSATERSEIPDPITGEPRYIHRINGMLGAQLVLVDRPNPRCVDLNPDGKCPMFNLALSEKKKRRKE